MLTVKMVNCGFGYQNAILSHSLRLADFEIPICCWLKWIKGIIELVRARMTQIYF